MLRVLSPVEATRLQALAAEGINFALLQPTETGLGKAIMDATAPLRDFLREQGVHDYATQGLGAAEHGRKVDAVLLGLGRQQSSQASLYRPKTKSGDPRIWFAGLPGYARPDDILAVAWCDGQLGVVNLSLEDVEAALAPGGRGPLSSFLRKASAASRAPSVELLGRLREIASRGPLRSVMPGRSDTAIGRTLEAALGIKINSSKAPDFKGIELKAFRPRAGGATENRKTLFAKVPDWRRSTLKSSREILMAHGYARGSERKLYCTVSAMAPNSQGLFLQLEGADLEECHESSGAFACWSMDDLCTQLRRKHAETFWVAIDSRVADGHEYFVLGEVTHTSRPIDSQLGVLIDEGDVTLDHLIKADAKGRVTEKGPLFKIEAAAIPRLFAPPRKYDLR